MRRIIDLVHNQKGNTLALMSVVILVILAMAGMVIDTGVLIEAKIKLYSATKSAAMAAIQSYDKELWETTGEIALDYDASEMLASEYLNLNLPEAQLISVNITQESLVKSTVAIRTKCKVNFFCISLFGIKETIIGSTVTGVIGED